MLELPSVTLYAYATVFVPGTIHALNQCLKHARFGRVIIFSHDYGPFFDGGLILGPQTKFVHVPHFGAGDPEVTTLLRNGADQANVWIMTELPKHADLFTEHQIGIQWDGFIVNPAAWNPDFLRFDYIGAAWDNEVVGNNGFWLTSKKLLKAMADLKLPPIPQACHPSDIRLSYTNCPRDGRMNYLRWPDGHDGYRGLLENAGCRWAPKALADRFSVENKQYTDSFGFHGLKTMHSVIQKGLFA